MLVLQLWVQQLRIIIKLAVQGVAKAVFVDGSLKEGSGKGSWG